MLSGRLADHPGGANEKDRPARTAANFTSAVTGGPLADPEAAR
jgi:hypothetical protein